MKVFWSEGALFDWETIAQYIASTFGRKAFADFDKSTDESEAQIAEFPNSGTPFKSRKFKNLGLRFVYIRKLSKMIYHIDGERIIIDVIWDTRQSPKRLKERLSGI
jgi:plasmid stabilization system protein ParE